MKLKRIMKIALFIFLICVAMTTAKADTITTHDQIGAELGDGTNPAPIGNYEGTNYWHLRTTDLVDLFCMNRGLAYEGYRQFTLKDTIEDISSPYLCAVVKVGRANNGSLPYSALQEAIWSAEGGSDTYKNCSFITATAAYCDDVREKRQYDEAKTLKTKAEDPKLTSNISSDTMKITSDNSYYVSSKITVTTDGIYSLDISDLPQGSFISKSADCKGDKIEGNTEETEIYACIPTSASLEPTSKTYKVKASRKVTVNDIYEYYHVTEYYDKTCYSARTGESASIKVYEDAAGLTNYQNLGMVSYTPSTGGTKTTTSVDDKRVYKTSEDPREVNATFEVALTVPVKAKISKKDITNEEELPGAHIVITDSEDNILLEYDSTNIAYEFYLMPGKYKLKETAAPEGYDPIETVFEFEILEDRTVQLLNTESDKIKSENDEITLYNTPTPVVPATGKDTDYTLLIVGGIVLLVGIGIFAVILKRKK